MTAQGPDGKFRPQHTGCKVDGCTREHHGRGYCNVHYYRWRRNGHTDLVKKVGREDCTIDGCEEPQRALGYCNVHYQRVLRHGDPHHVEPPGGVKGRTWSEDKVKPHGTTAAKQRHRRRGEPDCEECDRITSHGVPKRSAAQAEAEAARTAAATADAALVAAAPEPPEPIAIEELPDHLAGFLAARRRRATRKPRSAA